jgi:hypothetical protein
MSPGASGELPRIQLSGAHRMRVTGGECRIRVKVDVPGQKSFFGTAQNKASLEGQLRAAADATVDALRQAISVTGKKATLELKEVTAFDAFGKPGVMVSLRGIYRNKERALLGFAAMEKDVPGVVVKAVLDAAGRFLVLLG